jgi:cell division protein FtsQ
MSLPTVALGRRNMASPGVAAPDDKRFRRPDIRPAGRRRFGWWAWRVGRMAVPAAALLAIAFVGARNLLASEWFAIGRVTVRGNTRLSTTEVEALVQGIHGQNILSADLNEYQRRLMDSPWVGGAIVRRVLPGTIEVRILERVPMAVARIAERLYLIDAAGVVVDEFGPQYREFDLPVIDGLVAPDAAGVPRVDPVKADLARQFLDALQDAPALRQRVSQIDLAATGDVVVLLDADTTAVHLGETRFVERLRTYEELAPVLRERLRDIEYVDMRYDERVYVKSKGQYVTVAKPNGE